MSTKFEGFLGGSYTATSQNADMQQTVNLVYEKNEAGGRDMLVGRPGYTLFSTMPTSSILGMVEWEGHLFVVSGTHLYEVLSNGTTLDRGTLTTDGNRVQMFLNGDQLFIVSAGFGWIYQGGALKRAYLRNGSGVCDLNGAGVTWVSGDKFTADMATADNLIVINDVNYAVATFVNDTHVQLTATSGLLSTGLGYQAYLALEASSGDFVDGYFLAVQPPSGATPTATTGKIVRFSNLRDGAYWDPLDNFVKEGRPDNISRIFVDHKEVFAFGNKSTEVFRNTGSQSVFESDPSGFIDVGCLVKNSVVKLAGNIFFLGGDSDRGGPQGIMLQGFQPRVVSTPPVEAAWMGYIRSGGDTALNVAYAFAYVENKHSYWIVQWPLPGATWVYDLTTGMWCEWKTGSGMYTGGAHVFAFGKHLIADVTNGNIHESGMHLFTDNGTNITCLRRCRHISENMDRIFHFMLTLDIETGTVPSGSAPNVSMRYTDTDGAAWSSYKTGGMGTHGQSGLRIRWRCLGASRDRVYEVSSTANCQQAWVGAYLDVEKASA